MLDRFSHERLFALLVPILHDLPQRFSRDPPQQADLAYTADDPLNSLLDLSARLSEPDFPADRSGAHLLDDVPSTVYQADERLGRVVTRSTTELGYPCVAARSVGIPGG